MENVNTNKNNTNTFENSPYLTLRLFSKINNGPVLTKIGLSVTAPLTLPIFAVIDLIVWISISVFRGVLPELFSAIDKVEEVAHQKIDTIEKKVYEKIDNFSEEAPAIINDALDKGLQKITEQPETVEKCGKVLFKVGEQLVKQALMNRVALVGITLAATHIFSSHFFQNS